MDAIEQLKEDVRQGRVDVDRLIPVVSFKKGQREDDVAAEHRARFQGTEGVLFLGKAQEKVNVFRTEKRTAPNGKRYPWIVTISVPVNQFYFYCIDEDFGPFFLKYCTYFPYNAKLCINGHEYVKRQPAKEGIALEPLGNGVLSCANPKRLQQICDGLSAEKIDSLLRKWPVPTAIYPEFGKLRELMSTRPGKSNIRKEKGLRPI